MTPEGDLGCLYIPIYIYKDIYHTVLGSVNPIGYKFFRELCKLDSYRL